MALETVQQRKFVKAKDIPMGGKITGFVVGKYVSQAYPDKDCIVMRDKDTGAEFIASGGTLAYFFKNNNQPGFYYEFTRVADRINKRPGSQPSPDFLIAVDRSLKTETVQQEVLTIKEEQTDSLPPF